MPAQINGLQIRATSTEITGKNMFHLDPPPDFQGLRKDLPVETYQRYLPHWRQEGATYFVTFRLHDALPIEKQKLIQDLKRDSERENPEPHTEEQLAELHRLVGTQSEKWLDAGLGGCLLRSSAHRNCLRSVLHFFDLTRTTDLDEAGKQPARFDLSSWVMMPNHVHLLVRPLEPKRWSLEKILQSWKRQSAREINRIRQAVGTVWLDESHDSIVRDPQHLWRCLQYIGQNPVKAQLPSGDYDRWVCPEWEKLGWRFHDD